jgi:large subunit ribosomal protein L24
MPVKYGVKREDNVVVLSGKDSGKKGRVLKVLPKTGMALVEGVHFIKRHTRPNQQKNIKGGIVERESPLHVAKLMVICPACSKPGRVARKSLEDGRRVRACRHCGAEFDK